MFLQIPYRELVRDSGNSVKKYYFFSVGGWGAQSRPETFGIDACAYWDYDACCSGSSNSSGARRRVQSKREPRNNPPTCRHPTQVPEPSSVCPGPKT